MKNQKKWLSVLQKMATFGTPYLIYIKIDGIDVEQVDHAKLLGVTISHDLSWNKHVENTVKKAGKRLYMMYSWNVQELASPT